MGTRGVTKVIRQKEEIISQYGQWDHYPSGQGVTILNFLKRMNLEKFNEQLDKCRWFNDDDISERESFAKSIGAESGWMTMEQANQYNEKFPLDTRDHGADILNIIYDDETSTEFALSQCTDTDWLEGVYTIDLDLMFFRVQFHDVDVTFSINDLPDEKEFLKACKDGDDED